MKAVVYRGIGDIGLEDVPEPKLQDTKDAIIRLTASAICGTDLHMVRGTLSGMQPGTILGHEGVGVVEQLGRDVRNFSIGDRVVIMSTIACGYCSYCRAGYYSQCDNSNPNGKHAGTAFFGGPQQTGPFNGLQAEKARIPFANVGMIKLPSDINDNQAIMVSDIFPTGYFGADMAEIHPGDTVAVFGCGPVGQFAIAGAKILGAGRILAVDHIPSRLDMARAQGAEVINFESEDPVSAILDLTGGIGVDRAIDAVGIDAQRPHHGPAAQKSDQMKNMFDRELDEIAPEAKSKGKNWHHGDAPSQVLSWAIECLAKAGTLSIIGVYPESDRSFPIGAAMNKNLTVNMGNCNHRKYAPLLLEMIQSDLVNPEDILTNVEPLSSVIDAYKAFDQQSSGWVKAEVMPGM
jgi:threonine dehydrogenase-like Zn-dependent dehydrogenase